MAKSNDDGASRSQVIQAALFSALSRSANFTTQIFQHLKARIKSLYVLVVIAIPLLAIWYYGFSLPGVGALFFGDAGQVHVSSPSVYTRERLVNDRNDHDFWLRSQLNKLDELKSGPSSLRSTSRWLKLAPTKDNDTKLESHGRGGESVEPDFLDVLSQRIGRRAVIRQEIIENSLDDRHDLTGNSIYGLKFDASVIFNSLFQKSAVVDIRVSIPDYSSFSKDENNYTKYFRNSEKYNSNTIEDKYFSLYKKWISNLEWRINAVLQKKISSFDNLREFDNKTLIKENIEESKKVEGAELKKKCTVQGLLDETLGTVLGGAKFYTESSSAAQQGKKILLTMPEPWRRYINMTVDVEGELKSSLGRMNCSQVKKISVDPVSEFVTLVAAPVAAAEGSPEYEEKFIEISEKIGLSNSNNSDNYYIELDEFKFEQKKYYLYKNFNTFDKNAHERVYNGDYSEVIKKLIEIRSYSTNITKCLNRPKFDKSAEARKEDKETKLVFDWIDEEECIQIDIPSGYWNFVSKIAQVDTYAYSLFPKMTTNYVATRRTRQSHIAGNRNGVSGKLGEDEYEADADFVSQSFGYTDSSFGRRREKPTGENEAGARSDSGKSAYIDGIRFGWIMRHSGSSGYSEKSQFALVAVPAWIDRLDVRIETGFVNSFNNYKELKHWYIRVPIPADYEAIDGFIVGRDNTRKPKITVEDVGPITLVECEPASISIPGERLWRSTLVTLGNLTSRRITVMPDMGGIVAEFERIPKKPPDEHPMLRVWTSEGYDTLEKNKISVVANPNTLACQHD